MLVPFLSSYQTLENSTGSLDPLGMYTIADRLAMRLTPDLRERMKHPRYLTAMAVGSIICSKFSEDELATDELSPPWQVYEWYVVSAFVKRFRNDHSDQLIGLPGREKATSSLHEGIPLSAVRYLKTPTVFGFNGVYRTLAKGLQITEDNHCGEFGVKLIDIWEKEQGLNGFRLGLSGTRGNSFRNKLKDAVVNGLNKGSVDRSWGWGFFAILAEKLAPKSPGRKEATLIYKRLLDAETPSRAEVIQYLISKEGGRLFETGSEKVFHSGLLSTASDFTKQLLLAIQAYERFARLLYNAFYETLIWMNANQKKANIKQLASLAYVEKASRELNDAYANTERLLDPFIDELKQFDLNFQLFQEKLNSSDWVNLLFEHHFKIQKNKPPIGKAPWVLEHGPGSYLLNTTPSRWPKLNDEYVHQYRTNTLQSFMIDLGKIKL